MGEGFSFLKKTRYRANSVSGFCYLVQFGNNFGGKIQHKEFGGVSACGIVRQAILDAPNVQEIKIIADQHAVAQIVAVEFIDQFGGVTAIIVYDLVKALLAASCGYVTVEIEFAVMNEQSANVVGNARKSKVVKFVDGVAFNIVKYNVILQTVTIHHQDLAVVNEIFKGLEVLIDNACFATCQGSAVKYIVCNKVDIVAIYNGIIVVYALVVKQDCDVCAIEIHRVEGV